MSTADINRRFHYEPPDDARARKHQRVRALCKQLALILDQMLPDSPEKTRAIDAVDDACKHANAALARGPLPAEPDDSQDGDGEAGTRAPRIPFPSPTSGGGTISGGSVAVQVYLNDRQIHRDAFQQAQLARLRNGPIRA